MGCNVSPLPRGGLFVDILSGLEVVFFCYLINSEELIGDGYDNYY